MKHVYEKWWQVTNYRGKDLMNIGIYSAIYFVIVFAVAMLGYIPIMMPMLCVFVPLNCGNSVYAFSYKSKAIWNDLDYEHYYGNIDDLDWNGSLRIDSRPIYRINC